MVFAVAQVLQIKGLMSWKFKKGGLIHGTILRKVDILSAAKKISTIIGQLGTVSTHLLLADKSL